MFQAKAMRLDLMKDTEPALHRYRTYVDLPLYEKHLDPVEDCFVRWRIRVLAKKVETGG